MSSTKDTLKQLSLLFSPSASSNFPSHSLPDELLVLLDSYRTHFSRSYSTPSQDTDKERSRWRDGLLDIWAAIEPESGSETQSPAIGRVSAFLELLTFLSAAAKDDDSSAIISRSDIGSVWWSAVLKRVLLGVGPDASAGAKKAKQPKASQATKPARTLVVSITALAGVKQMIVWAMLARGADDSDDFISAFALTILAEFNQRKLAFLAALDHPYAVANLEEVLVSWAEKSAKAFFAHIATAIDSSTGSLIPSLSLLLGFLSRHSDRAYHALNSPLLPALTKVALLSPAPENVTFAAQCLVILLVTLPVIIGQTNILSSIAAYGRIVSCGAPRENSEGELEAPPAEVEQTDGPAPDPLELFTVLYGLYPANFMAFVDHAGTFLSSKGWTSPRPELFSHTISLAIRDRSKRLIRMHALNPALIGGNADTELTDRSRWEKLESADVRAECDRNVIQVYEAWQLRGSTMAIDEEESAVGTRGRSSTVLIPVPSNQDEASRSRMRSFEESQSRAGRTPVKASTPPTSRSRSPTPHMPATTHFTNFQALQSSSTNSSPRRSQSRFRSPDLGSDLSRSVIFGREPSASLSPTMAESILSLGGSANGSRAGSHNVAGGLLDGVTSPLPAGKLETQLVLLQGEVDFQNYLKQLHIAHMGTLHREKVLESGAEAERQGLYQTTKTLKKKLEVAEEALLRQRSESSKTKENWISHIDDLKEKLRTLREQRQKWDHDGRALRSKVEGLEELHQKAVKDLASQGAELTDLKNQVQLDQAKMDRIAGYEARIEGLTKTVALADDDLINFKQQRRTMDQLVGAWKKSDLIAKTAEAEAVTLKATVRDQETELVSLRQQLARKEATEAAQISFEPSKARDDASVLRKELDRLRARNLMLEEELADRD